MNHENHALLISKIEVLIPYLSLSDLSTLYSSLGNIGQPLSSPIMHKIYSILKNAMFEMDIISIAHFASGCISNNNISTQFRLYNQSVSAISRNLFRGFLWRYVILEYNLDNFYCIRPRKFRTSEVHWNSVRIWPRNSYWTWLEI